jgi:hypothetical protein
MVLHNPDLEIYWRKPGEQNWYSGAGIRHSVFFSLKYAIDQNWIVNRVGFVWDLPAV